MAERYYLFRGSEVVYRTVDPDGSIGAGDAHKLGQPGDVLILMENTVMSAWNWQQGDKVGHQAHWNRITDPSIVPKYRTLLLLQA